MNKVAFFGTINNPDHELIAEILAVWVEVDELKVDIGAQGEEVRYQSEAVEFHCYAASHSSFMLDGKLQASIEDAKTSLEKLKSGFEQHGISASFEYVALDDDGNETGAEHYLD